MRGGKGTATSKSAVWTCKGPQRARPQSGQATPTHKQQIKTGDRLFGGSKNTAAKPGREGERDGEQAEHEEAGQDHGPDVHHP